MGNRDLLYSIREMAFRSEFWMGKCSDYYRFSVYDYAPMVKDELFTSLFDKEDVVGTVDLTDRLGRPLKAEELKVCPLSAEYLLFDSVLITESQEERKILEEFDSLIKNSIRMNETRAVRRRISYLKVWEMKHDTKVITGLSYVRGKKVKK